MYLLLAWYAGHGNRLLILQASICSLALRSISSITRLRYVNHLRRHHHKDISAGVAVRFQQIMNLVLISFSSSAFGAMESVGHKIYVPARKEILVVPLPGFHRDEQQSQREKEPEPIERIPLDSTSLCRKQIFMEREKVMLLLFRHELYLLEIGSNQLSHFEFANLGLSKACDMILQVISDINVVK